MEKQLYNTYRSYIKKRFGEPVLKVSLNGGFSCPNRDGKISYGGCSFCEIKAFSRVHDNLDSVEIQLAEQIKKNKHRFNKFIAYLQPFSNTYGSLETLKKTYEPLLKFKEVVGIALGTRPDCLEDKIYDYLESLSKKTYLSVELGLQSASEAVLEKNNRGHNFSQFKSAAGQLSERGVEVVAHIMIGLPGEKYEDVIDTANKIAGLPVDGIKIHQLMIVKDTAVEKMYEKGELLSLDLNSYAELAGEFIARLRPDQLVHRIMADCTVENGLIAPLWSADKLNSVNYIRKVMINEELFQGEKYNL